MKATPKKAFIVVGLGYGDEGKGLATDFLCLHSEKCLVVRFNGGQQAGHTVVTKGGQRHVFSNFGAGTFRNIPTYWSHYCTFSPGFFLEELQLLPVYPKMYIHKLCPVTTHYDVLYNRALEFSRGDSRHGSCGLGYGATVDRHHDLPSRLYAQDILKPSTLRKKMKAIRSFYKEKINQETSFNFSQFEHDEEDKQFEKDAYELGNLVSLGVIELVTEKEIFSPHNAWQTYIFEGAQGILLDIDFGQRPHITKSYTTSKNAMEIIHRNFKKQDVQSEILYVTRVYQTRHGAGPFRQTNMAGVLRNIELETNYKNDFQGEFRTGHLDMDRLNYSLKCDANFSADCQKNLLITCVDQLVDSTVTVHKDGADIRIFYTDIPQLLKLPFKMIRYSFSNCAEDLV